MWKLLGVVMMLLACGPIPEASPECGPSTCSGCCTATGRCVVVLTGTCGAGGSQCASCGGGASCRSGQCVSTPMPVLQVEPVDAGLDAGTIRSDAPDAGAPDGSVSCPRSTVMPQNHAINGDFECGGVLPFHSSGGGGRVERVSGRTGRAARFTIAAGLFNNEFTSTWRFRVTEAGTWCARAFVKGTAPAISMRLYLAPPGSAAGEVFDIPGPVPAWSPLPPTLTAVSAMGQVGDEGFLVLLDKTHTLGATIEVDDVDVWRSADGRCRDSR